MPPTMNAVTKLAVVITLDAFTPNSLTNIPIVERHGI